MRLLLPIVATLAISPTTATATVINIGFTGFTSSITDMTGNLLRGSPENSIRPHSILGSFTLDTALLPSPLYGSNGSISFGSASIPIPFMSSSITLNGRTYNPHDFWNGNTTSLDAFISQIPTGDGERNVIGASRTTLDTSSDGSITESLAGLGINFNDDPNFITALMAGSLYRWDDNDNANNLGSLQLMQRLVTNSGATMIENAVVQFNLHSLTIRPPAGVPEPAPIGLLGAGLLGLALSRRRHRQ